jgi:hypothetical protein
MPFRDPFVRFGQARFRRLPVRATLFHEPGRLQPTRPPKRCFRTRRLSTPLDDPMLFAQGPSDPLLGGFTRDAFAPLAPPPGIACRLVQLRHDPRTNPRSRSSRSFLRARATCLRRSPLAEHPWKRNANLRWRRAPPTGYPSIRVASPNPEGQESPSYHRQGQGPASQRTPRRVCLGYRPDAFHYRPSGASDSFSEPTRVTPDSSVPRLLPAHVTSVPLLPPETAHLRRAMRPRLARPTR